MDLPNFGLAAILFVLSLVIHQATSDCPYQVCSCSGSIISCQHIGLDQMPPLMPTSDSYTTLRIYDNRIQDIPASSLPANLKEIDFGNNPILTISADAFNDSAMTLETLTFISPQFSDLPVALMSLKTLKTLTIKNIPSLSWNLDIIKHLGSSLQNLVLNSVGLTAWPSWIQHLPRLVSIRFSNDPITDIPDNAFDLHTDQLTTLSIIGANLSSIPAGSSSITALQILDLSNNHIQDVDHLPASSQLSSLYLNDNQISDAFKLVYGLLPYANSLNYLYVNANQLTSIPHLDHMNELLVVSLRRNQISDATSGAFSSSVITLELSDNNLQSIPTVAKQMSGLTRLYLNGNSIQDIQPTNIPAWLSYLDLQSNQIQEIRDNVFPANSSLKRLRLPQNPISNISPLAFENLANLDELNMQDTRISRPPLALSSLTSLTTLNLEQCPDLVCTCQESSLLTWIQSRGADLTIKGSCGVTDVADFFDNMAGQCPT